MRRKSIYVAATSQHVGKTTVTLGLVAALQRQGVDVGYCKPLGQQFLRVDGRRVDKDAVLFADSMAFDLEPQTHSPVILGPGDTARYLENPHPEALMGKIHTASRELQQRHELVVFEGTGHPGVGSVVGLSNPDVAQAIGAETVLVLEGGIGNTLDRLALCKSMFQSAGVDIIGVIINKVFESKMGKIRHYLQLALERWGVDLLGIMPYDEVLIHPSMEHIVKAVDGTVLTGAEHLSHIVCDTVAGQTMEIERSSDPARMLLVVTYRRLDEALGNFKSLCNERNLAYHMAGIIVTQDGELTSAQRSFCQDYSIPVATSPYDTYDAVVRIGQLVAKIDTNNPTKIDRAVSLFREHVDLARIIEA